MFVFLEIVDEGKVETRPKRAVARMRKNALKGRDLPPLHMD